VCVSHEAKVLHHYGCSGGKHSRHILHQRSVVPKHKGSTPRIEHNLPTRSKRPCSVRGCPNLSDSRWCSEHSKDRKVTQSYDFRRGSRQSRGYDAQWLAFRPTILERDSHLCQECARQGIIKAGNEVDHIIPIIEAPERRLDPTNTETLCKPHHSQKTYRENHAFGREYDVKVPIQPI